MNILIQQEIALHQFEIRQDEAQVKRLIHPSFYEVGRSGTSYNFESIIKMMAREKPSSTKIHSQNYECFELEPKVQLLCYKSALIDSKGMVSSFTKRCSIWALVEGLWQIKYHQGTPCEPFELQKA